MSDCDGLLGVVALLLVIRLVVPTGRSMSCPCCSVSVRPSLSSIVVLLGVIRGGLVGLLVGIPICLRPSPVAPTVLGPCSVLLVAASSGCAL